MSELFIHSDISIDDYIKSYSDEEDPVLYELFRETNKKVLQPRMLSGHIQGKILEMLTRMMQPKNVLEIGTYTGYGTICIAKGLPENGFIDTIEINDELDGFIQYYIQKAGVKDKIHTHTGKAQDIIPQLNTMYDFIFIDGDKREYPEYLKLTKQHLIQGGFILADNVLWNGKVVESSEKKDKHTQGIQEFNKAVKEDPDLENVIFPLRDGLMAIRKK
jgi:predicted O-methyltransferase YrrM